MKGTDNRSLILSYIYLAVGCTVVGTVMTFVVLVAAQYLSIDISENPWLLAVPAASALFLNVLFIELYRKIKNR